MFKIILEQIGNYPHAIGGLLMNPAVHSYQASAKTLDMIMTMQKKWLGYLE